MSYKDKKFNDFRDMPVWQKAFALLIEIYILIKYFPTDERLVFIKLPEEVPTNR